MPHSCCLEFHIRSNDYILAEKGEIMSQGVAPGSCFGTTVLPKMLPLAQSSDRPLFTSSRLAHKVYKFPR